MTTRVYIGDLGSNGSKQELEKEFEHYGPLKSVWVARNPPGFAFIEFEDPRDADEAVRAMDGRNVCGAKIRVEFAKNSSIPSYNSKRGPRRGPPPAVVSSRYRRRSRYVTKVVHDHFVVFFVFLLFLFCLYSIFIDSLSVLYVTGCLN